ncbi:heparinase II/III family protein [Granulibacter bethesdensis]|uniref:heparinase II/III family protein n=1 Tax=Granulibacter bethesdensis TaxID=364410 RepID=UPI00090B96D9|nr:heparinase II/III family protein [Granulibacter bethesdensis]APH60112.1 putative cytosolic protein [Granulibacter bethesdensis]
MSPPPPASRWVRGARRAAARLPTLRLSRAPDAPLVMVRDLWPGDATRGARLLRGEYEHSGIIRSLQPGAWGDSAGTAELRAAIHGFSWLRDLRALGTDGARLKARSMVADWIGASALDSIATRPDVTGARVMAWLGHYDFFAASADDNFRQRMMARLVADARALAFEIPPETADARALTVLKGLLAAAIALPDKGSYLARVLKWLPKELDRQILPDGSHVERSPSAHYAALRDLVEMRGLLQSARVPVPNILLLAIERLGPALRVLRHGDGGLALFNGSREENASLIDLVLAQAGRGARATHDMQHGGWQRLQAGRSVVIVDTGLPARRGLDRHAHAGTLAFEFSSGRDRIITNCGALPAGGPEWREATRATAAHSTLVMADTSSSEVTADGLGRRPSRVTAERLESEGAIWLEATHDGWRQSAGLVHRRHLYMAANGDDVRGEDSLEGGEPRPYALRFHLHPAVHAIRQTQAMESTAAEARTQSVEPAAVDGAVSGEEAITEKPVATLRDSILLRTPQAAWLMQVEGGTITVEESVYLGGQMPRQAEQVVISVPPDGPRCVKWAITRKAKE